MSERTHQAYMAIHRRCGGMLAAVVVDPEYPEDWTREVARWARLKVAPEIRLLNPGEDWPSSGWCACSAADRKKP